MAEKNVIAAPVMGMMMDMSALSIKDSQYPYALNACLESKSQEGNSGVLQNDGSNLLTVNFPAGFQVIGKMPVPELDRTLFFMVDESGDSLIGELINCSYNDDSDDKAGFTPGCKDCLYPTEKERLPLEETTQTPYCTFHTLAQDICLGFDMDHPVRARYKITDCTLNVYFTDNLNQRKFIYFDLVDGNLTVSNKFKKVFAFNKLCNEPVYSPDLDCNKLKYHPNFETPCIKSINVITGGELKAGVYQAFVAYSDDAGIPMTEYFPATNPVPIFTKYITFDTNYKTDKALKINIDNLDQTFLYSSYNVVIAETIDNFTSFKLIGTFPVTQTNVIYSGGITFKELTSDDVFFRKTYYAKAANITSANRMLFFSNLSEFPKPNLQRVAIDVKLYWQTVAIPEAVYSDPRNTTKFRGYNRDEVYPFGIEFITAEGEVLGTYHIPGPSKEVFQNNYAVNVDDVISNNDVLTDSSCNGLTRNKRWQVYNTGVLIGSPHEVTLDCDSNKLWEWGEFSYWESIDKYPNDPTMFGDLCGQPIRYHKFPDSLITHIHDSKDGSKTFQDKNIVFPIGIRVDHQSVVDALDDAVTNAIITQSDRDRITAYRIVRGNRVGHESIVAKGLLFDMWSYSKNDHTYYYPNYPYNSLQADNFISNDPNTYSGGNNSNPIPNTFTASGRYTFHSPDVHFRNRSIGTELKLETLEYGQSEGYFNLAEEQAKQKFLSAGAVLLAFAAGIAAAFSATTEKECVTYTVKSDSYEFQDSNGETPFSKVNQSGYVSVGGSATVPPITTSEGRGDLSLGSRGTDWTRDSFQPFDKASGQSLAPVDIESHTHTTCKGTTYQLLSALSGNAVGAFLQQAIYRGVLGIKEMDIIIQLIKALIPLKNLSVQYNSAGKYVNYKTVANSGNKVREVKRSAYLDPTIQLINESINAAANQFTNVYVNNWNRERSVYLKVDDTKKFPNPSVTDDSRFTFDQADLEQGDLYKRIYKNISSYYASVKNFIPDQYGNLGDIDYIPTGHCDFNLDSEYGISETGVFGGDTFINRFALKRKMPFFLQTRFKANDQADVKYSELGNAGFPNYYFNTEEPLMERISGNTFGGNLFDIVSDLLGVASTRLDAKKQKFFYQSGFIHLYNYGIPYFFVESDVNVDYRHGENQAEKDFYPHQADLDFWLQEKNVPITEDNYYFYNNTYSKQNKEAFIQPQVKELLDECKVEHPSLVINSLEDGNNDSKFDSWLIFKANNAKEFPAQYGRVIGLDGIENDKVLVRFENSFQIFNAYDVLSTDAGSIQVDRGGVFASRPKEFGNTTLGFGGTQHVDLLQTEFGHIWTDAKRGQIFNLATNASGLDELAKSGMKNWFKENLPFQITKDFPTLDIDNNFKGLGLHMSFDKRFNRMFLTKLDYKKIGNVNYSVVDKKFYAGQNEVFLNDENYFCNRSFTISYNFATKTWVSYHSFKPNFYVDNVDYIQSGINNPELSNLWSHGLTNKSYQVYYGKLYPFIVEVVSSPLQLNGILNSVEYMVDVLRYHNSYDWTQNRLVTFNKAWIYNDLQHSGQLELVPRDENNLAASLSYPKLEDGRIKILVTNRDNRWFFNQFWDTVNLQTGNIPFVINGCNNSEKVLNEKALNYFKPDLQKQKIRGRQTRVRLENDKYSNYSFVFHILNQQKGQYA